MKKTQPKDITQQKKKVYAFEKSIKELFNNNESFMMAAFCVVALIARAAVALSPYSGATNAPHFGDFECHRTWMEITHNMHPKDWYIDNQYMNISYWPMDYPPLCAYTHKLMALVVEQATPEALQLGESYGHSSKIYVMLMRAFVIFWEFLIFVPPLIKVLNKVYPKHSRTLKSLFFFIIMMNPGTLFVDHGHFQLNQVMHGLVLWGVYFMMIHQIELAVIAMVLAVNFKQMALYFAIPFGVYALALIYQRSVKLFPMGIISRVPYILYKITLLGLIFVGVNALLWLPWIKASGIEGVQSIFTRIFPIRRGIFEDKVASFWCVLHNFYKVNTLLDRPTQLQLTTATTLFFCIPSCILLLRNPNNRQFLLTLFNVSMVFYLFSFQVHEKQILSPLLFFTIMIDEFKHYFTIFLTICNFSMFPLYEKDYHQINYIALTIGSFYFLKQFESIMINDFKYSENEPNAIIFNEKIQKEPGQDRKSKVKNFALSLRNFICTISVLFMIGLHLVDLTVPPPKRYPHLYIIANNAFSFASFVVASLYAHCLM